MASTAAIRLVGLRADGEVAWLVAGTLYAMGKYLFGFGASSGEVLEGHGREARVLRCRPRPAGSGRSC